MILLCTNEVNSIVLYYQNLDLLLLNFLEFLQKLLVEFLDFLQIDKKGKITLKKLYHDLQIKMSF